MPIREMQLGEIWQDVVYTKDIRWAINQGFLVAPEAKTVVIPALAMEKIKTSHGDFSDGDLGKAMAQAEAGPLVASAYAEHCRNSDGTFRRGICFTPTIDLAESFVHDFRARGIPTELVLGSTPREERRAKYRATADGTNAVLMSVGVLTTGFDLPAVEVAVIARPTKSGGLYTQMVGRVLRPSPDTGKTSALILDVVGASRLGLASIVDLRLDRLQDDEVIELDEIDEFGCPMIVPKALVDVPEDIAWQDVNPFDGTSFMGPPKPQPKRKPRKNYGWNLTDAGIPFLAPTSQFESTVFVWHHRLPGANDDGSDHEYWVVGEKAKGRAKKIGMYYSFEEAVLKAEGIHPGPARLSGPISDSQKSWLEANGVDCSRLDKQEASRVMSQRFATWDLDPKR